MPKPVNSNRGADVDGGRAAGGVGHVGIDDDGDGDGDADAGRCVKEVGPRGADARSDRAADGSVETDAADADGGSRTSARRASAPGRVFDQPDSPSSDPPPRFIASASIRRARRWLDGLGMRLWPARCLVCREAGDGGRDLCVACAAALPYNRHACGRCAIPLPSPATFDGAPLRAAQTCGECLSDPPPVAATHAAFVYGAPIDTLLPRFKFHQDLAAGRLLGQLMLPSMAHAPRPDALVALPLHRDRLRQRGYDQALELARPLARALDLPLHAGLLLRTRATAQQSQLDAAQRRRNVRGAFQVDRRAAGASGLPARVALVDDVMTTGATLHAAAAALRRAGVARVDAWVCARVP